MKTGLYIEDIHYSQGDFNLNATLDIPSGSMACLLGPSGSGKTTILRLTGGFEEPLSGKIMINGRDITNEPPEKRKIGIVFQDYALFPHMSVADNITYGIRASGLYNDLSRNERKEKGRRRVAELLDLVRLPGYENRKIESLSGGEQQRIALARALAPEPELLLLDEPLSALDVQLRAALRREIKRIQETLKLTTLYITHDQEEALALSDKLFVMNQGGIVESGPPETLYSIPGDIFTGSFLGISNTIRGRINEFREDQSPETKTRIRFKSGDQEITVSPDRLNLERTKEKYLPDSEVLLFFRPEECLPTDEENSFRGRIIQEEYRGSTRFIVIDLNGKEIKLFIPPEMQVRKGEEFSFSIMPGKGLIFPSQE
ncbi:MAG: ABC transporter ATP-binding protein [Spirochaetales bacterium]|nr:ABC transporter ATP-binding protein [Spirochaetales bacterium]